VFPAPRRNNVIVTVGWTLFDRRHVVSVQVSRNWSRAAPLRSLIFKKRLGDVEKLTLAALVQALEDGDHLGDAVHAAAPS